MAINAGKKILNEKIDHLQSKVNEVVYVKGIYKEAEKQRHKTSAPKRILYYDHAIVGKK